MTTEVTLATFQTACAECADAIDNSQWATARRKLAKASALLLGLPESAADGSSRMDMRKQIAGFESLITAAEESSGASADDQRRFISTSMGFGS